jgi:hypothetical protein
MSSAARTRGTYISHNGRNLYVETHTLEACNLNFRSEGMSQKMYERLCLVFSTPTSQEPSQIYIPIAFDYCPELESDSDRYIISGFWNPGTQNYEFDN